MNSAAQDSGGIVSEVPEGANQGFYLSNTNRSSGSIREAELFSEVG